MWNLHNLNVFEASLHICTSSIDNNWLTGLLLFASLYTKSFTSFVSHVTSIFINIVYPFPYTTVKMPSFTIAFTIVNERPNLP